MFKRDDSLIIGEPRPSRADAVKNNRLLLDTARQLFDQYGVDAVSMTQIAQEAGVGKGTLYRNFSNKVELCYALLDEQQRELQDTTLYYLRTHPDNPLENLRWFLQAAADFVIRNRNILNAGAEADEAIALDMPAHLWWRQTIYNLLRQLGATGDVAYLSDTLYVMLHVNTVRFQQVTLGYTAERIKRGLLDTLDRLLRDCSA